MSSSYIVREGVGRTVIYGDAVDASKTNIHIVEDTTEKIPTAPGRTSSSTDYVLRVPSTSNNAVVSWEVSSGGGGGGGSDVPNSPSKESSATH